MRQKCDECGIYSVCNDDGVCGDCQSELNDDWDDEDGWDRDDDLDDED